MKSEGKGKASQYRGVYRCGSKWKTQIQENGVQYYIGVFDSEEEASREYLKAARSLGRVFEIDSERIGELKSNSEEINVLPHGSESNSIELNITEKLPVSQNFSPLDSRSPQALKVMILKLRLGKVIRSLLTGRNLLAVLTSGEEKLLVEDSSNVEELRENLRVLEELEKNLTNALLEIYK